MNTIYIAHRGISPTAPGGLPGTTQDEEGRTSSWHPGPAVEAQESAGPPSWVLGIALLATLGLGLGALATSYSMGFKAGAIMGREVGP